MSAMGDLRKHRADETIERDYGALRDHVLRTVARSLRRRSIFFDEADLDGHYNIAWQGLYNELLAGVPVPNPTGFLVTVVMRRAIDDSRRVDGQGRAVTYEVTEEQIAEVSSHTDVADRLDDNTKLKHFMEGLKDRLTEREREAATLCYINGFSRPEAAEVLGVERKRMEKIMDAVSKKIGAFVRDIESGAWCESRRSLINAYAFSVLDKRGERYQLACEHLAGCPACRRYVRSVQGLAAVLPPVVLPLGPLGGGGGVVGGLFEAIEELFGHAAHTTADAAAAKAGGVAAVTVGSGPSAATTAGSAATAGGSAAATGSSATAAGSPGTAAAAGPAAKSSALAGASAAGKAGGTAAVTAASTATGAGGGLVVKAAVVAAAAIAGVGGGGVATGVLELSDRADGPAARSQIVAVNAPALPAGIKNISLPARSTTATSTSKKRAARRKQRTKATATKRTVRPAATTVPSTPALQTAAPARTAPAAAAPSASTHTRRSAASSSRSGSEFGVED